MSLTQRAMLKMQLASQTIAQASSCSPFGGQGSIPSPTPTVQWGTGHQPALHPPPTGNPQLQELPCQVHHKPGCEAAWRSPWHAPRGVSGRLILIITVLSLPGPVQAQASPGHETCTGLPPCRAVLGRLCPACRENLHPDCQAQQHLEAFPLLSTK